MKGYSYFLKKQLLFRITFLSGAAISIALLRSFVDDIAVYKYLSKNEDIDRDIQKALDAAKKLKQRAFSACCIITAAPLPYLFIPNAAQLMQPLPL